ncbi:hypothetical protein D9613_000656 [Agrocybe pediades]|uniref:Integral membrane bound transporter domain-containing protein n=1 Tax=Agrocybe pediades TaxID=84607 RepID=A0A8H4R2D8_9AGAR|nr:hypothetical protein D9613_000656 [Agrocybe pediades]
MQPSPIDVPARRRASSSHLFNSLDDPHFLVGSPDPLGNELNSSLQSSDAASVSALPSSTLGNPQSLPPLSPPRRRLVTPHNAANATARTPTSRRERNPEHQWSLFGQLMENEGYLSPNTNTQRGRHDASSIEDDAGDATSTVSGVSPRLRSSYREQGLGISSEGSFISSGPINDATPSNQYDSDNDSESIAPTAATQEKPPLPSLWSNCLPYSRFLLSPISINVLKCALAYFLASLFTFTPFLSQFISDIDYSAASASGHMVATIAVYFNPAKTVGAMIEADLFCLIGILYSFVVCLVSMNMFWWFEVHPGWEWAADLVALGWIGLSFSAMAWMKVWMENPSFNTGKEHSLLPKYSWLTFSAQACSMTAITIFIVVIKEGGLTTLLHVSGIILCGSAISNLVCFLLWPQSARSNLQLNMTKTLDSFATLLPMLTTIFLLEDDEEGHPTDPDKIQYAVENHQNSFTSLRKSLREAKSEWILTSTPWDETQESETSPASAIPGMSGKDSYEDTVDCLNRLGQHLNGLRSGTRLQHDITKAGLKSRTVRQGQPGSYETNPIQETEEDASALEAAAAMFSELVDELGPPLRALSMTSTSALRRLRDVCFESRRKRQSGLEAMQPHEFADLIDGIEASLTRFESTSNHAVLRLYRRTEANKMLSFIFTLQEFAKEVISLVDSIERIYYYEQRMLNRRPWWSRLLSWMDQLWANLRKAKSHDRAARRGLSFRKSLSHMIPHHRIAHPAFPKIRPHAPDTIQTPPRSELTFTGKVKQIAWTIGKRLKERDTKYAIKAGIATMILAFPAFLDSTRPTFVAYWGDWALISYFVVISPTIGARFLGTLFGAAVAVIIYSVFPDDAVALSVGGFFFSLPCFYYAVAKPQYLSASRFVLLTYNLTCLFRYNLRERDVSVIDIGFHRAIAVVAGILWAAFISRFWWPSEARRELSNSLSEFCLHLGWLYTRLVASNSFAPVYGRDEATVAAIDRNNGRGWKVTRLHNSIHEFMAMLSFLTKQA